MLLKTTIASCCLTIFALVDFQLFLQLFIFIVQIFHPILHVLLLDAHRFDLFQQGSLPVEYEKLAAERRLLLGHPLTFFSTSLRYGLQKLRLQLLLMLLFLNGLDRVGATLCHGLSLGNLILFFSCSKQDPVGLLLLLQLFYITEVFRWLRCEDVTHTAFRICITKEALVILWWGGLQHHRVVMTLVVTIIITIDVSSLLVIILINLLISHVESLNLFIIVPF